MSLECEAFFVSISGVIEGVRSALSVTIMPPKKALTVMEGDDISAVKLQQKSILDLVEEVMGSRQAGFQQVVPFL